ncbi:hypothetical protein CKM354_000524100 [Cercospora kikuchii]|uniref:Uncharacterized protein n=1 Tax=Cercospora kikuchii TaxID=84275 RepID=A0A9P3FC95_9PEZI|nr:uncharacterized protein CKM354_000524100 [Cercospora kikuchii]GIZ41958.1 hypothetical protein CKM354_000524100 [Cercospora kikuchii]
MAFLLYGNATDPFVGLNVSEGEQLIHTLRTVAGSYQLLPGPNIEYEDLRDIIEWSAWIYQGRGALKMAKVLRDTLWRRKLCGAEEDMWFRFTLEKWLIHGAGTPSSLSWTERDRLAEKMDELYATTA